MSVGRRSPGSGPAPGALLTGAPLTGAVLSGAVGSGGPPAQARTRRTPEAAPHAVGAHYRREADADWRAVPGPSPRQLSSPSAGPTAM
ncbi:hypothetical protein LT493_17560 [Streptomyces tricolor]|nr:hypothetical protein [Streptomyces tricolor]